MTRTTALTSILLAAVSITGCGGSDSSPTTPTPTPTPPATTRIISLSGDLAFGNVNLGEAPTRTYTITNTGNAPLSITGITAVGGTGIAGLSASFTSGTIAAGASQTGTMRFTPTLAQSYSTVMTIAGDQTSGTAIMNVSGVGVNNAPAFTVSGSGANVFTIPATVTRVRIFGDYAGTCENFIVRIAGRLVVNEILGSCSSASSGRHFDGTFSTPGGGLTEVLNSVGISWTFVEVR